MVQNLNTEPSDPLKNLDIIANAFKWVVETRRAVRVFSPDSVPERVILGALSAAHSAPSASNLQPWDFYWIRSEPAKAEARRLCLKQPASESAHEIIVCVANFGVWKERRNFFIDYYRKAGIQLPKPFDVYYEKIVPLMYAIGPFGILGLIKRLVFALTRTFQPMSAVPCSRSELLASATKNAAFACQNFMLSVRSSGYDTCPLDGFDPWRMKRLLGLSQHQKPILVIAVGKRSEGDSVYGPKVRCDIKKVIHII